MVFIDYTEKMKSDIKEIRRKLRSIKTISDFISADNNDYIYNDNGKEGDRK